MLRSALIVLVGVGICVCGPTAPRVATAASSEPSTKLSDSPSIAEWNDSIFAHMKANKPAICPIANVFWESQYATVCEKIKFPKVNATLKLGEPDQFLCTGIYDRAARLCYLDSRRPTASKPILPETSKQFDAQVKNFSPKNAEDEAHEFCKSWTSKNYPVRYKNLTHWIEELNNASSHTLSCEKMCTNEKNEWNSLCSVLIAMDTISQTHTQEVDTSNQGKPKETTTRDKPTKNNVGHPAVVAHRTEQAASQSAEGQAESANANNPPHVQPQSGAKINDDNQKPKGGVPEDHPSQQQESVIQHPASQVPANNPPASVPEDKPPQEGTKGAEGAAASAGQGEQANPAGQIDPAPPADGAAQDDSRQQAELDPIDADTKDGQLSFGQDSPDDGAASHDDSGQEGILSGVGDTAHQDQENPGAGEGRKDPDPSGVLTNKDPPKGQPMPSEKQKYIPHLPGPRDDDDTHFFGYFTVIGVICIAGYVGYHNKQKILAMVVEGRRSRGGRGRRRPSTANYRKLDCTLEEAVTSQCNSNVTHVIY